MGEPADDGLCYRSYFLFCIPVKFIHDTIGNGAGSVRVIRVLSAVAMIGAFLLNNILRGVEDGTCFQAEIIVAGLLFIPCFYISDAKATGLMHQNLLPRGS